MRECGIYGILGLRTPLPFLRTPLSLLFISGIILATKDTNVHDPLFMKYSNGNLFVISENFSPYVKYQQTKLIRYGNRQTTVTFVHFL